MIKTKKTFSFFTALFTIASLTSCYFFDPNVIPNSNEGKAAIEKYIEYRSPSYDSSFTKENLNLNNIGYGANMNYLPSKGNQKLLVIPIETTDYSFSKADLEAIEDGFFGDSSDTYWESVSSFYENSSYGQLHISGTVTDALNLSLSSAQLAKNAKDYADNNKNYTDVILGSALNYLKDSLDLSEYDTNDDGYIDGVWMVYSVPYNANSSVFWAYTTWADSSTKYDGVKASCYAWASVEFFYDSKSSFYSKPDSHTFIHETGHMMGLDDYYSYDYDYPGGSNSDSPIGGVDMMDANVGDHMAFSKYLLGWIEPTVLTDEYLKANNYKLSMSSLTENKTHSSFILPIYKDDQKVFNDTPFDEYLIMEFYTPTNLNEKDKYGYSKQHLGTYSKAGVVLYHVNAKIGKIEATRTTLSWDGYVYDKLPNAKKTAGWGSRFIYSFLYNNTRSYCNETSMSDEGLPFYRGRLVSLLPATGSRIEGAKTGYSSNQSLYSTGSSFSHNEYPSFCFDNGSKPKYGFTITSINSTTCAIQFSDF